MKGLHLNQQLCLTFSPSLSCFPPSHINLTRAHVLNKPPVSESSSQVVLRPEHLSTGLCAFPGKLPPILGQSSVSTTGPGSQRPLGSGQLSAWACSHFSVLRVGLFQESANHQPALDLSGTLLPWKHEARRLRSQKGLSHREVVPGNPLFEVGGAASLGLLPGQSSRGQTLLLSCGHCPPPFPTSTPNLMPIRNLGM